MMNDNLLTRSFSKHERKKLGYGALAACLLITLSFFIVFNPYLGPLPLCKSSIVLALQLSNLRWCLCIDFFERYFSQHPMVLQ
jgi:hypothetical protein